MKSAGEGASQPARTGATLEQAAAIRRLGAVPRVRDLNWPLLRLVLALRIHVLCGPAMRDPLLELTTRFRSVPLARQAVALFDLLERIWPEPIEVGRPCCVSLLPDEATIALMGRAVLLSDRAAFSQALDGLVRADRHEAAYETMQPAMVELAALA